MLYKKIRILLIVALIITTEICIYSVTNKYKEIKKNNSYRCRGNKCRRYSRGYI